MLFGAILGFAVGVVAGWLGAPLAGKELRSKAASPAGRRSLADALKRRDQTLAGARQALQGARAQAEEALHGAAETAEGARSTAEDVRQRAGETAGRVMEQQRSLVEQIKERIEDAREAAREGYDEGVADAERLYDKVRKGRDLE